VDKVAVSTDAKGKLQGANRESLQHTESQLQESDFAQTFHVSNSFFRSDGRGFDLSRVPSRVGLESGLTIQACTKGSEPCGCASCSEKSTAAVAISNETDEEQELQPDEPHNEQAIAADVAPAETGNPVVRSEVATIQDQSGAALIVEDSVADLADGQMKKADFLLQLHREICRTIEPVLASVGQTSDGCPFLESWMDSYRKKDVAHIEQTVKKYTPGAASAATASEYISAIGQRAVQMVEIWARMGMLSGTLSNVPAAAKVADDPDALLEELEKINVVRENRANDAAQKTIVQPKAKAGGARHADDPVAIQKELGDGQPLASEVRSRMEPAFGMSFAHVRSHTGTVASALTNKLNARAFTVGHHVAFGAREYAPGTPMGDALIAHELAHVAQQKNANASVNALETGNLGYDALEADADQVATSVVTSLWHERGGWKGILQRTVPALHSGVRLQRCASNTQNVPKTAEPAQKPPAGATCNPTSKASTYVPTEGHATPSLGEREFGTTSKLAAFFKFGACKQGEGWRFYLDDLTVNIKSAVKPIDFKINVPSASDQVVKKETYSEIVQDLEPIRKGTFSTSCGGNSFRDEVTSYSRRKTFWNHKFVEDHEAFHRKDWNDMYRVNLIKAEEKIRAYEIPTSQAESAAQAVSGQQETLTQFMIEAYQQTCKEYSPKQESRAYDNGKPQYQGLVDAINQRAASEKWTP
jgi:hypothetical protein